MLPTDRGRGVVIDERTANLGRPKCGSVRASFCTQKGRYSLHRSQTDVGCDGRFETAARRRGLARAGFLGLCVLTGGLSGARAPAGDSGGVALALREEPRCAGILGSDPLKCKSE